jgi:putative ABC transport system permease protein
MNGLAQDIRYALRGFRRSPGFAAIAVLTLALGIGANTAIFSVVDGVLLRPLRFPSPDRLTVLFDADAEGRPDLVGWPTYVDWRRQSRSFSDIAVMAGWSPTLTGGVHAEPLEGLRVSDGYFRILGVSPAIGRDFLPEEDRKDRNHEVILSDGLFRRRFGGDRGIVGRTISMAGTPYLVVGVLPAGFESVFSTSRHQSTEIWSPLGYDASLSWACRTCHHLRAIGRLKPGVSLARARAELGGIEASLYRSFPKEYASPRVDIVPLGEQLFSGIRSSLLILLGAVGLVLAMASANVASLLMARLGERRREIALRFSLGATRGRVVRMLLTESLILSLLGGAAGLAFAGAASRALAQAAPIDLPRLDSVAIDLRVLATCLVVSLLTGILFGILPAISVRAIRPAAAIADGYAGDTPGRSRRSLLSGLVVADVALAVLLLSGAGLLVRSLTLLFGVDPGFQASGLVTMNVHLSGKRYREDPAILDFYRRAIERVRAIPGVQSAAVVSQIPLGSNFDAFGVHPEGLMAPNPENDPSADRFSVSSTYLRTMKIPLLAGRDLTDADRAKAAPVVIVNRALAQRFWGGSGALGKRVKVGGLDGPWRTIVGIAGDVRHRGLDAPQSLQIYLPQEQFYVDNDMVLAVRASGRLSDVGRQASAAIRALDRDQVVDHVGTMEETMADSAGRRRFAATVLGAFAGMALLLATIGIYGVVARSVTQRRREFGIRMALGAQRSSVLRLVAAGTLPWIAAGLGLGLAGAFAFTRLLASQLFGVGPRDPATLGVVVAALAAIGVAASLIPARGATRLDPSAVLRES